MVPVAKLTGVIQHYAWGGHHFIADLLGKPRATQPNAEYWLGTHPLGEAQVVTHQVQHEPLSRWLATCGDASLPYLFKVLDVKQMLSIQLHPTVAQAEDGYAREDAAGIPLSSSHRNYKDKSDKPEMMLALSPFWLLHGLRAREDILAALRSKPFLTPLAESLEQHGIAQAIAESLQSGDEKVASMQTALSTFLLGNPAPTDPHNADYWIHRWLTQNPDTLAGILTVYFMNIVRLEAGQAIYQPPGLLHAYLEGQNIELMANSDNVLRAGLTPKHIDVEELLRIGRFNTTDPEAFIIQPHHKNKTETTYPTPFQAFELSEISGNTQKHWQADSYELLFCIEGKTDVLCGNIEIILQAGESAIVKKGQDLTLISYDNTRVFRTQGCSTQVK